MILNKAIEETSTSIKLLDSLRDHLHKIKNEAKEWSSAWIHSETRMPNHGGKVLVDLGHCDYIVAQYQVDGDFGDPVWVEPIACETYSIAGTRWKEIPE